MSSRSPEEEDDDDIPDMEDLQSHIGDYDQDEEDED